MRRVLFRVDAGPQIGLGHLQRSLALADALRDMGVDSTFVLDQQHNAVQSVVGQGFDAKPLGNVRHWTLDDLTVTLKYAAMLDCGAIIIDSHVVEEQYLVKAKNAGLFVVIRDDLASYQFNCNIVLNGNADGPYLPYKSFCDDTVFLLGMDFIVLRHEFRGSSTPRRNDRVDKVIVVLGAADHLNLMPSIVKTLDANPGNFAITAVIGPYFDNEADVRSIAHASERPITLVNHPERISALMDDADLAISSAGQTLYELASFGCPTIAIRTASNQGGQLKVLEDLGFVRSAGNAESDDVIYNVSELFSDLLSHHEIRAGMGAIGQQLVDGNGAQRVAATIRSTAFASKINLLDGEN